MLKAYQRIRVQWSHCDAARIIFNPHYYIWMDQATHQLFDAAGLDFFTETGKDGFRGCPLVTSSAQFVMPLYLGDVVTVWSQIGKFGNTSFTVAHEFHRGDDVVATGSETRVWATDHPDDASRMKGIAMPQSLRDALSRDAEVDTTV